MPHVASLNRYGFRVKSGVRTRDIILLPIGGVARLERMPEKPSQEILVAIAGPLVNVAIVVILVGVRVLESVPLHGIELGGGIVDTLLFINIAMVLFNLLPAFPMDGGRVLRAALALRLPYARATRIASTVGQVMAVLLGIAGILAHNYVLMFIGLFVFLAAGEERSLVATRTSLVGLPVSAAMLTEFFRLDARDPLQRAVDYLMAGSQQDFPVMEDGVPIGVLTRADLVQALQRVGAGTPVGEILHRDDHVAEASEPLEAALLRMRTRRRSTLPVLSQGRLVGLLTLENVSDLLLVRGALRRFAGTA